MKTLFAGLLITATAAHAQMTTPAPPADNVLPTVTTALKRDTASLPYRQLNTVLRLLDRHAEGLFRIDFKVDVDKAGMPAADMRMVVRSDDADYPIKLAADGTFDLPLLPEAEAKTADFATNLPKGRTAIRASLELTVPPEQLTMATVRRLMRVARTLREELLPWYLRWAIPRIEGVRICSATPTWELEWREAGQLLGLPLPATPDVREPGRKKGEVRHCTVLIGQERWPDAARLLPPPDTRLGIHF